MSSRFDPARASFARYVLLMASTMLSSRRSRRAYRRPAADLPDDVADPGPPAEVLACEREELARLRQALAAGLRALGPEELTVILLGSRPGLGTLSQREIGELLGMNDTAVHRLKKSALAKLREHVPAPDPM